MCPPTTWAKLKKDSEPQGIGHRPCSSRWSTTNRVSLGVRALSVRSIGHDCYDRAWLIEFTDELRLACLAFLSALNSNWQKKRTNTMPRLFEHADLSLSTSRRFCSVSKRTRGQWPHDYVKQHTNKPPPCPSSSTTFAISSAYKAIQLTISIIKTFAKDEGAMPLNVATEMRFTKHSDSPISPAYGEEVVDPSKVWCDRGKK